MMNLKSIWVSPKADETDAPKKRIVHAKVLRFRGLSSNIRVGFREGRGYMKCGSEKYLDAVRDADIYVEQDGKPKLWASLKNLNPTSEDECIWYEIPVQACSVCVVVRRSRVDNYWPCFNVVRNGVVIEADEPAAVLEQRQLLSVESAADKDVCHENISKKENSISVQWKTPFYSFGLRKKSAGADRFVCDCAQLGKLNEDLLKHQSILFREYWDFSSQGPIVYPLGEGDVTNRIVLALHGKTVIGSDNLTYHLFQPDGSFQFSLRFTMQEDAIKIHVDTHAEKDCHFALLSLFRIALDPEKTQPTLLGVPEYCGETGRITFQNGKDAILHFPRYGSIRCSGEGLALRMTSARTNLTNMLDIVLPNMDCDDGTVFLKKGDYSGDLTLCFHTDLPHAIREDAPQIVKDALSRYLYSALPFRMDTATFTNNGSSMGCPMCLDVWSEICEAIGDKQFPAVSDMLRSTIEIWLSGAPAYASGWYADGSHKYEDEYLMTGSGALAGIGRFLCNFADEEWFNRFRPLLIEKLQEVKKQVPDEDGIPSSPYRRGISGEGQWSSSWYDVISYGGKDAWAAAILYRGLLALEKGFARFGDTETASFCKEWAQTMKAHYWDTFRSENGRVAGWKSTDGQLHDHTFLAVNGLAAACGLIPQDEARQAIEGLWNALLASGYDTFELGLPGNVDPIPLEDLAFDQQKRPFGGYENAGITLSQSCHFLNGLLAVGMEKEACYVMTCMASGMQDELGIGGVNSGIDWKTWDGVPTGYEGLLCDQFGVIAVMLQLWGA